MKFLFLKMHVMWRRFRHGLQARYEYQSDDVVQLEVLMRHADPECAWHDRANWMIDVAEWLRYQPKVSLLNAEGWRRVRRQRVCAMLDWLDVHRDVRRQVQMCLQKTLREASGPELFSVTGLPHESAFFSELTERAFKWFLPRHLSPSELPTLFAAMFPDPDDAAWLLELDQDLQERFWKLAADDGISHTYWQQVEEALIYLTTVVVADGISPAFRQRLEPKMPLQATPFMALRREMEAYLRAAPHEQGALRSARMLIAVCQAQTDRIYDHLDEYGVSLSLVYRLERMRAQLGRMSRLIDVRASAWTAPADGAGSGTMQSLLADLVAAHHSRSSVRSLVRRSFALLARKLVERSASHGAHEIARDRPGYVAIFRAACVGGIVMAFTVVLKIAFSTLGLANFFEGVVASLNYVVSFLVIAAVGGVLAGKQPVITSPALAASMGELGSGETMGALLAEAELLLRSQAAAIFGNLTGIVPAMLLITAGFALMSGTPLMHAEQGEEALKALSPLGSMPLYAAFTGILLWLSSLTAGFADNWFALRRLRESLAHQRRLVHALGAVRAARAAAWLERHVASITGNVSLGILLGMMPELAHFFGLPLNALHVTLATGTLVTASASVGWGVLATAPFWLAVSGVVLIGVFNVGVAFSCALGLALRARDIPARMRRVVFRAVLRRFMGSPQAALFPQTAAIAPVRPPPVRSESEEEV